MDLQKIREELDSIDKELVALFEERMQLSGKVAECKIANNKQVLDRKREAQKLTSVEAMAGTPFNKKSIRALYSQIMSMSRKLQYQLQIENGIHGEDDFEPVGDIIKEDVRVVYQGVDGAYSQEAMCKYFGNEIDFYNVEQWRDAMEDIGSGKADFAVLPIENSTAGSVTDIYDLLIEFDNYIVGEQILKIEHALLGVEDAQLSDITTVYSHPQGFMQSQRYLQEHRDWQQISIHNTAIAAKKVLEDADKSKAAIASAYAAQVYGLKILQKAVNDKELNSTRFIVVSNRKIYLERARKITICFELPHESGSLYNILGNFVYNGLNMTKIESRPLQDRNWEYYFIIDFEGNLQDVSVKNALQGIKDEAENFKILGNY